MPCLAADYLYAGALAVFAITAIVATWWHSSLVKVLQLRQPATYELLGRPDPLRTSESNVHSAAMLRFILSGEYKLLNDAEIFRHARTLRACAAISAIAIVAIALVALTSHSAESTLAMRCWRHS